MACGGGSSGSGSQLPPQSSTPDFTLLISPSTQSVNGGGSTTIALSAIAIDGFSSSISVQVTGLSGGVSMSPGAITVDPGGIDILTSDLAFRTALTSENRTLKRALTDPRLVSGVGNAYSDGILHAAQLSPISLTRKLTAEEWERLFLAARQTLQRWIERLRAEATVSFPEKVTAFRAGMAVHGRYGEPCPRCGEKVLQIRYADKETNYCARCQTGGKVLADRGLSRLLGSDWPRTLDELEALTRH
jgi:formamidopyrimidine-DNA glycosylase